MLSVLYNKILLCGVVIFYSLIGLVHSCHSATNLAFGRPYTVSPQPNYPLSAPPTDKTSLTDGKYTVGKFWTQKTTLGWQPVKIVEILIDLEKVARINAISFSTARGSNGGVYYPERILAYVGIDKNHFQYVGDIADTSDNNYGEYQTKRFVLDNIKSKGRFVLLEISTSAITNSVFCDEIEVLEGNIDNGITGALTIEASRNLSEQTRKLGIQNEFLGNLAKVFASISTEKLNLHKSVVLQETDIIKLRGDILRKQFPGLQFLLESISPWATFSPASPPSRIPLKRLSLTALHGGYDHAAFTITNLSADTRKISFSMKSPKDAPTLSLYQTAFVLNAAMKYVADPLVPINGPITLMSGESKMIFATFTGKTSGTWKGALTISGDTSFSNIVPVDMSVSRSALPKEPALNTVNWGYLDFNLIKNHKSWATNDLFVHHTNVLVVPQSYLQGSNQAKPVDLSRLGDYLRQHKGVDKVLLSIGLGISNHKTVTSSIPFMEKAWQYNFVAWYEAAIKTITDAGFAPHQIYLYPYDEMEGIQVDDFIKLSSWAKKHVPHIKFYATISNVKSFKAIPYLDIVQIHNDEYLLRDLNSTKAEIWLYEARGPAKSLSPYSYYRLMAWKAFFKGYKGIGFWAYADSTGTAWDDFDGERPDYAVIYEGEGNTIISSRRWEAWRMGIEDYELLTMYAKAKGDAAAKALAKSVLDNPLDTAKADQVRRKILLQF